jgi:hypothetical protein
MSTIYMVVGVPGSGKSWVCARLTGVARLLHHDLWSGMEGDRYAAEILREAGTPGLPVLCEAPFSVSKTRDRLLAAGHGVVTAYIIEDEDTLVDRYMNREGRLPPVSSWARQRTYLARALEEQAFYGSSAEVWAYLITLLSKDEEKNLAGV